MTDLDVATANVRDTLPDDKALAALTMVLSHGPHLLGLEEWSATRNGLLNKVEAKGIYRWARPTGGGGPALWDSRRFHLIACWTHVIAKAGFVGHLPGRKDNLAPSLASVFVLYDEETNEQVALVVIHLTAEVQFGKGYRTDARHAMRVRRHRKERRGVQRLVRRQRLARRRVFVVGDTNYDSMPLPPLVACWEGHPAEEKAGTLGGRTVDYVYAGQRAKAVRTYKDASDHRAVIATYK